MKVNFKIGCRVILGLVFGMGLQGMLVLMLHVRWVWELVLGWSYREGQCYGWGHMED